MHRTASEHRPPPRTTEGASEHDQVQLTELLNETRILLPGTEVFLGFLTTLPFTSHFAQLDGPRRWVYVATFFSTVLALVLFVVPASYHRLARPIRHKERFKTFANRFLVAGLVPMSIAIVLATYLVSFVALNGAAPWLAGAIAVLILAVWWAAPIVRMHDSFAKERRIAPAPPEAEERSRTARRDDRAQRMRAASSP